MNNPPLVSILIPAYNAQEYIAETLESALAQTWRNIEIIVVNDGSSDRTLDIAQRFTERGVIVATQANQGAAATRNRAFSLSRGDYIQWLDADDLLSSDKIERQMAVINKHGSRKILVSSGWAYFIFRPRKADFRPTALWRDLSRAEWLACKLGQNLHMQTATWLVSRELTEAAGPWNTQLLVDDDGEYFCRVLMASEGVKFVDGARVYYRMAGYGRLSYIGASEGKVRAQFVSMKLHISFLRSMEDTATSRSAAVQYLRNWSINFYPDYPEIFQAAQELAAELGGTLEIPRLSWKYDWIRRLFGWPLAKRVQLLAPRLRWTLVRFLDRQLSRIEASSSPHMVPQL